MSKKSSTFAPRMKRMYYIPMTEIMQLELNMSIALANSKGTPVGEHSAPVRREPGDMRSY